MKGINKLIEICKEECPSYYGLMDNITICEEDGNNCEECWKQALESEVVE